MTHNRLKLACYLTIQSAQRGRADRRLRRLGRQSLPHGGKNVKGRKRHVLVDTTGLILMVVVTAANISDRAGAKTLFARLKSHKRWLKRLFLIYTDGTYRGETFVRWIDDTYDWILEAVLRVDNHKGFRVVPKRWVVERTFGWLHWCRRLSKDYERLPQTSETFIYLAMIRIMIRRLA